jgi:hypothetical protein
VLLNILTDPDADYVEDDHAREALEELLLQSVKGTALTIMELDDNTYYLGLRTDICRNELPAVMTAIEMCEKIAALSIGFKRELKKVGLFKHVDPKTVRYPEPYMVQSNYI